MVTKCSFANHLANFIGQTVTVFTTSGGNSGSGFTGILMSVNNEYIRLLNKIGSAPSYPICNLYNKFNNKVSIVDIPISRIVSFVHN